MDWNRIGARLGRVGGRVLDAITGPRLQLWTLILGSPVVTLVILRWVDTIKSGAWPADLRGQQLALMGHFVFLAFGLLYLFVIAIAAGLITGVKLTGPGGFTAEIDTADSTMPPTTAKVEGEIVITPEAPDAR